LAGTTFFDVFQAICPEYFAGLWEETRITPLNPNAEVEAGEQEKTLIGKGLGRRRRGYFVHSGGRRGVHGVTRPTALGARQGL
jgi:hypothetical protein